MYCLDRAAQLADIVRNALLRENVQWRAELSGKLRGIRAVNRQKTRSCFQITRHLPGVPRIPFSHPPSLIGYPSAVVGSIMDFISETRLAGKPPWVACSRIVSSFGAI